MMGQLTGQVKTLDFAARNHHLSQRPVISRSHGYASISYFSSGAKRNPPFKRSKTRSRNATQAANSPRIQWKIKNGVVLVGSDAHYWPGKPSTAHKGLVKMAKELNPVGIIMNGDAFDGAGISAHRPIGWEENPEVSEQLWAAQDRMSELVCAAPEALLAWPLGNHDARFETRIAQVAPEYKNIEGVHLKDHFPDWPPCWAVWINDEVVVKHRWKGGQNAALNNARESGMSFVTGHLHRLQVSAFSDYRGTRWGVDCGTLADPYGRQFMGYTEDNPRDQRSGFAVLTFENGRLNWPEVVHAVRPGVIVFRGKEIKV